jgi:hypothetical protein
MLLFLPCGNLEIKLEHRIRQRYRVLDKQTVNDKIRRRPFGTTPCRMLGSFRLEICYVRQKADEGSASLAQ